MSNAYCQKALYEGEFRTKENYWMYLGFFSLISIAILTASIFEWRVDKGMMERAVLGAGPTETTYVTVLGNWSVELKALEYAGVFIMLVVLFACYVMASK